MSDTINRLMDNNYWYKSILQSDFVMNVPSYETLNHDTPFEKVRKLLVNLLVEDNGECDGYIRNLIPSVMYINNNLEITISEMCTMIHIMSHLEKVDTYLKRDDIVALDKCEAGGSPP